MDKKTRILDPSGQPIQSNREEGETNLPIGVQAFLGERLNSAIDDLREHNRDDLKDLARDHARKWRYLTYITSIVAIVSSLITLITFFYAPGKVVSWIGEQIDKKLTEPMLQESADRLIDSKMATYVTDKMRPLNQQATQLKADIEDMNEAIGQKQVMLEDQQRKLSHQLRIQELAIAAKAGSREAYTALLDMRREGGDSNDLLTASLKEIELFYDVDRHQLSFPRLVSKGIMKDPGYAVDEVIFDMRNDSSLIEGCINTLSLLKSKGAVGELCQIVNNSQDLRAVARATRAIEIVTGEKIRPLEFDKVQYWWQNNKDNKAYLGDYAGYCEVVKRMRQAPVKNNSLPEFISILSKTIDSDPNALHSMCLKAGFLAMMGDLNSANDLLDRVRTLKSDYYWLYVWETALKIKQGDLDSAINSVNSAFAKSPTSIVEGTVRFWKVFDPIQDNPKVAWPSKEKQDTRRNIPTDAESTDSLASESNDISVKR